MSDVISVDQLSETIGKELDNYNKVVINGVKAEAKKSIDKLVKKTKETAPKKSGKYRRAISSKKEWENPVGAGYLWYVKAPHYRLSHLLEYGHATRRIRNGKARTEGTGFIKKASDPIIEDYVKAVEEVIKNG